VSAEERADDCDRFSYSSGKVLTPIFNLLYPNLETGQHDRRINPTLNLAENESKPSPDGESSIPNHEKAGSESRIEHTESRIEHTESRIEHTES
jgi:hypothetical protein